MRAVTGISFLILTIVLIVTNAAAKEFWIKVTPKTVNGFSVEAEIETNIPGTFVLAARLVYLEPVEGGGFVGTGFVRFNGIAGRGRVSIDGCKTVEPRGSKLPNGQYSLEVFYYYQWPDNTKVSMETGIDNNIKGIAPLTLSTHTPTAANGGSGEDGLRWVVENVVEGNYWDPLFWRNKFGDMEEVAYRGPGNPKFLRMYYVKSINITLLVDESNSTILAYRMGLAHE